MPTARKRARGRGYPCACGEEKLRLTRKGVQARVNGWGYLFGECGGGVKLHFDGIKVLEYQSVDRAEVERVRSLPALKTDPHQRFVNELDGRSRERIRQIETALTTRAGELVSAGVEIGGLLLEARQILGHRHFGLWLAQQGLTREKAFTAMRIAQLVQAAPRYFGTFQKMGQEKVALLARLPEAKRSEVLEEGRVPIDGLMVPVINVSYRQLNKYVQSVVGKASRGRKPKTAEPARPAEILGLPASIAEAFQEALKHLQKLRVKAKHGWSDKERPAARNYWMQVWRLCWELQDDLKMAEL